MAERFGCILSPLGKALRCSHTEWIQTRAEPQLLFSLKEKKEAKNKRGVKDKKKTFLAADERPESDSWNDTGIWRAHYRCVSMCPDEATWQHVAFFCESDSGKHRWVSAERALLLDQSLPLALLGANLTAYFRGTTCAGMCD